MSEAIANAAARAAGFDSLLDAMITGDSGAAKAARPLIDDARPEDLVAAVDAAMDRGVPPARLKPAVSKLVNLLSSSLKRHRCAPPDGERLFSSLLAENAGLLALLDGGKSLAKAINDPGLSSEGLKSALAALRSLLKNLGAVETHYRKKENVLFPWFEARFPRYRCVRLMWEIQDDARAGLKDVGRLLDAALGGPALADALASFDPRPINQALGRLYFDLYANAFREEYALFPVMLALAAPDDGERLFEEARDFGYAFLDEATIDRLEGAGHGAAASPAASGFPADHGAPYEGRASGFVGRTGALPSDVLAALFAALPVDMTYVDADDKVRWFSDSPHRIFPRSPAIVGRDVRNCHPGASVDRVVAILEAFKRGERDRESFWIGMKGRFIYIEYYALRAPDGAYLGVLEASQDLTEQRALSGEKRLA